MSEQMKACPNCGSPVAEGQAFCQTCGAPVNAAPANTYEPQTEVLQPAAPVYEQPAAPVYEQPAAPAYEQPAAPAYQQPVYQQPPYGQQPYGQQPYGQAYNPADVYTPAQPDQGKSKKKVWIILGAIAGGLLTLILLIVLLAGGGGKSGGGGSSAKRGPNFSGIYNQYCESTWASYGSDYLKVDTNPYDWDDDGIAYYEAWEAIQDINDHLGLPSWLVEDMLDTSASDGVRSESFPDQDVTVTWTYHPDEGLEVTYKAY